MFYQVDNPLSDLEDLVNLLVSQGISGLTRPVNQVVRVTIYSIDALPIQIYRN
jgi:hypothetical protein